MFNSVCQATNFMDYFLTIERELLIKSTMHLLEIPLNVAHFIILKTIFYTTIY